MDDSPYKEKTDSPAVSHGQRMTMPAILCRDLRKTYPARPPVEAVKGLDLEIQEGECFGLLGPNGAGKTTTLKTSKAFSTPAPARAKWLASAWAPTTPLFANAWAF